MPSRRSLRLTISPLLLLSLGGCIDDEFAPAPADELANAGLTTDELAASNPEAEPVGLPYTLNPAVGRRWKLVWSDEFNGRPCDPDNPSSCATPEDLARAETCFGSEATPVDTLIIDQFHHDPQVNTSTWHYQYYPHLQELDKCNWAVSDHANVIHFQGPAGPIAHYAPEAVSVGQGELRLRNRSLHPSNVDCSASATDCPYESANVISMAFNGVQNSGSPGASFAVGNGKVFDQGGRLEIRARMPRTEGNMAALWTWQQAWQQPESEYDLLEYWVNWPEMSSHGVVEYQAGAIAGSAYQHVHAPAYDDALHEQWHVYAMEWEAGGELRYYLDNRHVGTIRDGVDGCWDSDTNQCLPHSINGNPFYLILWNLMIEYDWAPEVAPYQAGLPWDWVHIDWVRYHQACTAGEEGCVEHTINPLCSDPCGGFGAFDGFNCYVQPIPAGAQGFVYDGNYYYQAVSQDPQTACPYGGTYDGYSCYLGYPTNPGQQPFIYDNVFYATTLCSTTANIPNCADACPWPEANWDGANCYVGYPPANTTAFVQNDHFYHTPAAGPSPCPTGGVFDGTACDLGPVPSDAEPFVWNNNYYYKPDQCPYGGTWDPNVGACMLLDLPIPAIYGNRAFVWEHQLYYQPFGGQNPCPYGGSFDGLNCWVSTAPDGSDPVAGFNNFYGRSWCELLPDWQTMAAHDRGQVNDPSFCTP